jgi:formylglycine-generating enzyme required for sulfatase activity
VLLAACNNLGFVGDPKAASVLAFAGVKSLNVSLDGRYILFWDHAAGASDVSAITYEIYLDKWDTMPSSLKPETAGLESTKEEGRELGAKFVEMPDADAPVTKGVLLSSVKGVRSYTLEDKIQPNVIYAFQVRVVSPDGKRDANPRVMIYSAAENKIAFAGVSGLEVTQSGKLLLSWEPPGNLPVDIAPGDVSYEVFMDSTPDDVATVVAAGQVAVQSANLTDASRVGEIVDLPAERLPDRNIAPLVSQKGGRFYEIAAELSPSLTYIFQVKARGPGGEPGDTARVVVYRRGNLAFAGLQQDGATLSDDLSKITLSWEAATGAVGPVTYTVYADANFTLPLATTKDTRYEFRDIKPGTVYTFAVRAQDGNGVDANRSFAVVKVGALGFDGLQQSGVSVASDNSAIVLTWTPASNAIGDVTYVVYEDSKFSSVLGQTSETTFTIHDPTPGKIYSLGVRAKDANGFDDNTSLAVVKIAAMSFAGLQESGVVLAADNSKIELTWTAASDAQGLVTYVVYQDASFSSVLGQTTQTSYTISAPTPGKLYTLGVRAKDTNGFENNIQIVVLAVPDLRDHTPPDFSGLAAAETVSDTKILLRWDASPSADVGLYNVYYAHDLTKPIASTSSLSYLVTGLTSATSYAFVVRANDTSSNEEKNSVQKSTATLPYAVPNFAGIDKIENLGGVDGLTKLKVSWLPAGGTVTGYQVYKGTAAGGEDLSAAEADVANPNATSVTITGLASDTMYYFVVRAYDSTSGTARFDRNTTEKSLRTLQIKAPTFAGVSGVTPGAGGLGFTEAKATWGTPQANGVYDGFVVQYEAGTCAQGFSASPTSLNVTGEATREFNITGLTAQTNYRVRVRTRYSLTEALDTNTTCRDVYTSPPAPNFTGVGAVNIASGISGFSSLVVTWPAATSSFTYYKVEWSTSSAFATVGGSSQIADVNTLTKTLTGLPAKTLVYVRVSAVFDQNGVQLSSGASKVLSARTEPLSPTGEGISSVSILSSDSLKVVWTAPTNTGIYNGYKLWKYCGANASTGLAAKLSGAADNTYPTGQLDVTYSGLTSDVECCYQVRAYYDDGTNTLTSQSTVQSQCKTPTLVPPTFAGVSAVTNGNQSTGFAQLTVSWSAVDASESGLFSYYEIDWATTPSGQDWSGTVVETDRTVTSKVVTGLSENTTYYFRVRAVNANGTPSVSSGSAAVQSGTTTPKEPTGDNLSTATSIGSTKARLTYAPPNSNVNTGGLFNNVFLFIQAGTTNDVNTYRSGVETGGVAGSTEIAGLISAGKITLSSVPAVVRVPTSEIVANQNNNYEIWGLTSNQQVCIQAVAVYWIDGQQTKYLKSTTPTTRCVTPTATAPIFAGVTSLSGYSDVRDFNQMVVNWGAITGDCSSVEISATTTPNAPNFSTPFATASCSDTSKTLTGLTPNQDYYVQVRAHNSVCGPASNSGCVSGSGVELTKLTRPSLPTGEAITGATFNVVSKAAYDSASLTWTLPSSGYWNKIAVWRASGANSSAATTAVRSKAAAYTGSSGSQTNAPITTIAQASPASSTATTYTDAEVVDGTTYCYLVRAIYDNGVYYSAGTNDTVQCGATAYTAVSFAGVSSTGSAVESTWSDGTAKIKLQFPGVAAGDIEEFWVYYSPTATVADFDLTAAPWQIVDNTATSIYNPSYPAASSIYVGGQGRTFNGSGYYIVRAKHYGLSNVDTNTAVSNAVVIPTPQSNYVYVAPSISKLAYPYWIGTYEASLASGTLGADAVSSTETDLATCSYQFHVNGVAKHATCGSFASTGVAKSVPATTPVSATWHQAWTACRNATVNGAVGTAGATTSAGNFFARLATESEWRRASRWAPDNYANQWTTYQGGTGLCNSASGAIAVTGNGANCVSRVGAFDMAGNQREWVDQRLTQYDIANNFESRFSYGPQIGRILANGIDIQASAANTPVTPRYHNINPGANNLALLLGSDYVTTGINYEKQYDAETETWQDPTLSTASGTTARGFRCVAFPNSRYLPSMAQLAQTNEPVFTAADIPGSPTPTAVQAADWKIPENFYVKDVRPESVKHLLQLFPNTTSLAVWPLNQSSGGTQVDLTGNGRDLTASATLGSAAGLDGKAYANDFSTTKTLTSTDTLFNQTGNFTMGGWFYMSSWTGTFGLMAGPGYNLFFANQRITHSTSVTNGSSTNITPLPGWHHIVLSRTSGGTYTIYFDGAVYVSGSLSMGTTTGQFTLGYGCSISGSCWNLAGRIASAFFHAGITYTLDHVQHLYYGTMVSNNPYPTSGNLSNDGVALSWQPWSKNVCAPSCAASDDTAFEYEIYRYVEPTRSDIRTRTPWAIKHGPYATLPSGLTGANATAMPLDPLATDASGTQLCSSSYATTPMCVKVATISGSACNSGSTTGCSFTDKASLGNGFSGTAIYNYIMVVHDGVGNYRVPQVQRYRTPYLTGDFSSTATANFRTEQRWRRAAPFLVDEARQQNAPLQSNPQTMVYVPMDVSGLDHDFFIHKYEASSYSGTVSNSSPDATAAYPLQAQAGGSTWVNKAGSCYEILQRTGAFNATACGDGSNVNASSALLQSKQATSPLVSIDQGAIWKGCANTGITDGSGYVYYERLPTDSEWMKAADWGDVAQQGTVTQTRFPGANGLSAGTLESSVTTYTGTFTNGSNTVTGISSTAAFSVGQLVVRASYIPNGATVASVVDATTITMSANATASATTTFTAQAFGSCQSNVTYYQASASSSTTHCRSRYGAADMVGNVWEWTSGQEYTGAGFDNGVDGLWTGSTLTTTNGAYTNKYDLLRGFEKSSGGATVLFNGDYQWYTATLRGASRGGLFNSGGQAGRWILYLSNAPSNQGASTGGRCSR